MRISYKYRIYPSESQRKALQFQFDTCRYLYNASLDERIRYYKHFNKSISYNIQASQLPEIRKLLDLKGKIHSQSLQSVLKTLDTAYQNFFRRVKNGSEAPGFPRFKGKNRFKSILSSQCNLKSGGIKLVENKLQIYGIPGLVKLIMHRQYTGTIKTVAVKREPSGKYYIILSCDNVEITKLLKTNKIIGIDLGLNSFVCLDDGTKFHHPKPYKTSLEKLKFKQRFLEKKKRGSNNRKRAALSIAKCHEKIKNQRSDFQHKLSNKLIRDNDVIIIEDLNVKGMIEKKDYKVSKLNIADAGWAEFASKLVYKAEKADRRLIKVDPKNTSKMCSVCGHIRNLELSDRIFNCHACGMVIERDINAAINIKRLGTSHVVEFN